MNDDTDEQRVCANPECDTPLPITASNFQKYCDEHRPPPKSSGGKRGRPKRDVPPKIDFTVNLGAKPTTKAAKAQAEKDRIEKAASTLFGLVAVGVSTIGDEVCASALSQGAPALAKALADLSEFQPMIAKIFTPVSGSEQASAWLGVGLATLPIVIPVLAHHNMLPKSVASVIGGLGIVAEERVAAA